MLIDAVAGPLPDGCDVPQLAGVKTFVRRAKPGEKPTTLACPVCSGTGRVFRRRRGLRTAEPCRRCEGEGQVQGMPLVRLATSVADDLKAFVSWAREAGLRVDRKLLLREEGGASGARDGWATVWCDLAGRPLRRLRGSLVGDPVLGVYVERNGAIEGHVAIHAIAESLEVNIIGLWDVSVGDNGCPMTRWAGRLGRSIARRKCIRFPVAAFAAAMDRSKQPAGDHARFIRDATDAIARSGRDVTPDRPAHRDAAASC